MYRFLCSFQRCSMYMFRLKGLFSVIIIRLTSTVQLTVPIRTSSRCPSSSWWCRDPGPCARWVCVVLSFVLVGGLPPCGPHGFRFTPFDHFCTRNPVGYWSALHTCQPSDPIFKSYRIRFWRGTYTEMDHPGGQPLTGVSGSQPSSNGYNPRRGRPGMGRRASTTTGTLGRESSLLS